MRATPVQSLHGHQSPVESVTFDNHEEVVAAGAASGSIKVFDLDQAKGERIRISSSADDAKLAGNGTAPQHAAACA